MSNSFIHNVHTFEYITACTERWHRHTRVYGSVIWVMMYGWVRQESKIPAAKELTVARRFKSLRQSRRYGMPSIASKCKSYPPPPPAKLGKTLIRVSLLAMWFDYDVFSWTLCSRNKNRSYSNLTVRLLQRKDLAGVESPACQLDRCDAKLETTNEKGQHPLNLLQAIL